MPPIISALGAKDAKPEGALVLNVTTGNKGWLRQFSPMILGPVKLYGPWGAWNVENAWQFCKVYAPHFDHIDEKPDKAYWKWAKRGWADKWAHRYPMGKGAKPLASLWDGKLLDYIAARREIYIPLYETAVSNSGYLESLCGLVESALADGQSVYFFDYDSYDYKKLGKSFEECIEDSTHILGHGIILANMVERSLNDKN